MADGFRPRIFTAADEGYVDMAVFGWTFGGVAQWALSRVVALPAFVAGRLWRVARESFRNGMA